MMAGVMRSIQDPVVQYWYITVATRRSALHAPDQPLVECKRILRSIVPTQPSRLLYVNHVAETECACRCDD
jgi:hypothetical protein